MTLGGILVEAASRYGSRLALVVDDQSCTYEQLAERARMLARGLVDLGLRPGDRVAVFVPNSILWMELRFAVAMAGGVLVAINTRLRGQEVAAILDSSACRFLFFTEKARHHSLRERIDEALASRISGGNLEGSDGGENAGLSTLEHVVLDTPSSNTDYSSWGSLYLSEDHPADMELRRRTRALHPMMVANVQYTSGSSGVPRGVMLTHHQQTRMGADFARLLKLSPEDRFYTPGPFFHVAAGILLPPAVISTGGCLLSTQIFDPLETLEVLEKQKCTAFYGTSAAYSRILATDSLDAYDLSSIFKGWAAAPPSMMEQFSEALGMPSLTCMYGLTEATAAVTSLPINAPSEDRFTTNGKPLPGLSLRIVDPITHEELRMGDEGEIAVKGYAVMPGYYRDPAASREAVDSSGWLYTGDLGTVDARGFLHFKGRLKDVIRVGGENVSAREVEIVLQQHPSIQQAAVISAPDPDSGEVCHAFVELRPGELESEENLIAFCRQRLADFKVPKHVSFVTTWPTTGSGKIAKRELRPPEIRQEDSLDLRAK